MPLDFTLWADISKRMAAAAPKGRETIAAFKMRLKRTALATPKATVRKALIAMRQRAAMICQAKGLDIAQD